MATNNQYDCFGNGWRGTGSFTAEQQKQEVFSARQKARQRSEYFPSFFLFYLLLKGKGLFCREAFQVDSLAREEVRQDFLPPPHPCCSARDLAGPAPCWDCTWLPAGEQRAGGSSQGCPALTAAANPRLPPPALSHHRHVKVSWCPARSRNPLLLYGC